MRLLAVVVVAAARLLIRCREGDPVSAITKRLGMESWADAEIVGVAGLDEIHVKFLNREFQQYYCPALNSAVTHENCILPNEKVTMLCGDEPCDYHGKHCVEVVEDAAEEGAMDPTEVPTTTPAPVETSLNFGNLSIVGVIVIATVLFLVVVRAVLFCARADIGGDLDKHSMNMAGTTPDAHASLGVLKEAVRRFSPTRKKGMSREDPRFAAFPSPMRGFQKRSPKRGKPPRPAWPSGQFTDLPATLPGPVEVYPKEEIQPEKPKQKEEELAGASSS
jgi:hypothetical protein